MNDGERQLPRLGFVPPFIPLACASVKTFASWSPRQAGRGEEGEKRRPASPGRGDACLGALSRQKGGEEGEKEKTRISWERRGF